MNEYEWIDKIKLGDEQELKKAYKRYEPMVLKVRSYYHLKYFELDDWLQEGFIIFHRSALSFIKNNGVTFGLYFKKNFTRHIISLLRKEQAVKRRGDLEACSYENELNGEYDPIDKDTLSSYEQMLVKEKIELFNKNLGVFELKVMTLYNGGFATGQCAAILKCSESEINRTIKSLQKKFKAFLYE